MATALAVVAAFLLGLRVGIGVGHRSEKRRQRKDSLQPER
jgi:hypothetical protein